MYPVHSLSWQANASLDARKVQLQAVIELQAMIWWWTNCLNVLLGTDTHPSDPQLFKRHILK